MEQTMYDDADTARNNAMPLKPSFILDFNQQSRSRTQMDLGLLKLASPELEKYLIQQEGSVVTAVTPTTQILFPKCVTQEQENYARGFIDALDELHRRQGIPSHVIKKENLEESMSYNLHAGTPVDSKSGLNQNGNYFSNHHSNLPNSHVYSDSHTEISHTNGFFLINGNNNYNVINNNLIIVNNNISNASSSINNNSIPPSLSFNNNNNNNNNIQTSHYSTTSASSYNLPNNHHHSNHHKNNNNNNILLTNPDISLNENIFAKDTSPCSSPPYPTLPPAQTLLTRSPSKQHLHQSIIITTPATQQQQQQQTQLDSKNFFSSAHHNDLPSHYNKQALKRTADMSKLNSTLLNSTHPSSHSSSPPSSSSYSFTTTTTIPPDEHTNQTVPYLSSSSPPSISSTIADSPLSNSPSDEVDRLEVKRARNRLAAQKCRSRKLERIIVLSQRVEELRQQNASLEAVKAGVASCVEALQLQLQRHSHCSLQPLPPPPHHLEECAANEEDVKQPL